MTVAASRLGKGRLRLAAILLLSACAASCRSTGEQALELNSPSFSDSLQVPDGTVAEPAGNGASGKGKASAKTAFLPAQAQPATDAAEEEIAAVATVQSPRPAAAQNPQAQTIQAASPSAPVLANGGQMLTAGTMPEPPAPAKKRGFMSSLFGASSAQAAPAPIAPLGAAEPKPGPPVKLAAAEPLEKPLTLASLEPQKSASEPMESFPGVRKDSLFEIKRKSGLNDDSDIDVHEDEEGAPVRLASLGGMARLAPNGLLKQRESVDVACLKPDLVRILKSVERRFGRKLVVTSGYRSPTYNRKVNGARKSQHMYCAAADVQVPGVSKWDLAQYVRALPGRGGVGTYCHTDSVHVDVGPERDWNWRCRRRSS